jgi:hypothetical protein
MLLHIDGHHPSDDVGVQARGIEVHVSSQRNVDVPLLLYV